MAEPGDPKGPAGVNDEQDLDDLVGFASPRALAGRAREAEAGRVITPEFAPPAQSVDEREPDLFDPPEPADPGPFDRTETFGAPLETRFSADRKRRGRAAEPVAAMREALAQEEQAERRAAPPTAPMGLYAIYVLILLAVPTFGASAVLALLAVTVRRATDDALARSHFIYQQRTLWTAAVAAVAGGVLVVVNIGVFVLFLLALWVLARGATGVWKLKDGKPIANPRTWLF